MNYTHEMEKAMQASHQMGYAEYCRSHENRMKVERKRQTDYKKCKYILAGMDNQLKK